MSSSATVCVLIAAARTRMDHTQSWRPSPVAPLISRHSAARDLYLHDVTRATVTLPRRCIIVVDVNSGQHRWRQEVFRFNILSPGHSVKIVCRLSIVANAPELGVCSHIMITAEVGRKLWVERSLDQGSEGKKMRSTQVICNKPTTQ